MKFAKFEWGERTVTVNPSQVFSVTPYKTDDESLVSVITSHSGAQVIVYVGVNTATHDIEKALNAS